jgi:hypothetical protein
MSVGTSVKRFTTRSNPLAASGQAVTGYDAGTSLAFAIPPSISETPIQVGLTADNLLHKPANEPYVGPKQYGGGMKVTMNKQLMLYGDLVENFSNFRGAYPTYSGGAEISVGWDFYLRGGLFGFTEKGWGTGLGWVGPKIGVNYGFQSRRFEAERSFEHAITMDLYM